MSMHIWYIVMGGCVVTLLPRIFPVMLLSKINLDDKVVKFLKYIPISILTALVASNLLISNNKFSMNTSVIIAAIITAIVAIKKNNLLLTVVVGVISMAILRLIF